MKDLDESLVIKELKIDAKGLGIPIGAADTFIKKAVTAATKTLQKKSIVTELDVKKTIVRELKKYHADLAYVFENRDKII